MEDISETSEGKHHMVRVVNPETKDGTFHMEGWGYDKAIACIEQIARYVDSHAEDKDEIKERCYDHFFKRQ